ncbi:nucleolar transcription factor 1-like [Trachinotus anak]|uniref:nucleolar transcription factor 1-like n=1 Tax=Trachinotus anak TaxID=443729 RepID=UPI0039F24549
MSEAEIKTVKSGWTKENLQKLLRAMKKNISKCCRTCAYNRGLKTVNWTKVAFPPFSPEACQEKWGQILRKMRKLRSLTELIDEAEDVISDPAKNIRIHPEFPNRPTPPNAMFYEENWAKLQEQHPEMSHKKVAEVLYKKYKHLPHKEKNRYVKKHRHAMKEYKARVVEFRKQYGKHPNHEDHTPPKRQKVSADTPDTLDDEEEEQQQQHILNENGIKTPKKRKVERHTEGAEGLPPKPPLNGYSLFCKEQIGSMAGISNVIVWAKRWRDLTEEQRKEYNTRCSELRSEYPIKLNEFLKTLDKKEQQRILNEKGIKIPKECKVEQHTEGAEGLPPKPPISGYNLFCKEQMASMEGISKRHYVSVWARRWRDLTDKERKEYCKRCRVLKSKYMVKLNEFLKTFDEVEQQRILNENGIKIPKERKRIHREVRRVIGVHVEPKMPSRSGNVIFCKNQMELLRDKFPDAKERFIKVNQSWQELSTKEKEQYKVKVQEKLRQYSVQLQKWFKTLSAEEQEDYQTRNPSKCKYLSANELEPHVSEEPCLNRPSDSEDEDIEDSSSDEEQVNVDWDEDEEEEEEEEDDITFEMY